jgi:hypothetical protein
MDSKTNMGGITVVAAAQVYNLVAGSANLGMKKPIKEQHSDVDGNNLYLLDLVRLRLPKTE